MEFHMRKFNIQNHHRCDMASSCTSVDSPFPLSLSGDHIEVAQSGSQQRHDKLVMGKINICSFMVLNGIIQQGHILQVIII